MLPKTKEDKKTGAKSMRKDIAFQISGVLPGLKDELGETEFAKRIKKAAKLLSRGLRSSGEKKKAKPGHPVVKPPKKTASRTVAKPASKNSAAPGKKPDA
jgi:hypothetical protein